MPRHNPSWLRLCRFSCYCEGTLSRLSGETVAASNKSAQVDCLLTHQQVAEILTARLTFSCLHHTEVLACERSDIDPRHQRRIRLVTAPKPKP